MYLHKNFFYRFFRRLSAASLAVCAAVVFSFALIPRGGSVAAVSSVGSRGAEVRAIQERLKERGLFNDDVTGYYGEATRTAVKKFQKQQGIQQTGTAGPQTLKALGISVGSLPAATESNVYLLARIISAEARGEPYTGQVAVGAVILNRIEHPSFPDTLWRYLSERSVYGDSRRSVQRADSRKRLLRRPRRAERLGSHRRLRLLLQPRQDLEQIHVVAPNGADYRQPPFLQLTLDKPRAPCYNIDNKRRTAISGSTSIGKLFLDNRLMW